MVDRISCHSDNIRTRLGLEFSVPEEKVSVIPHGPFFYDLPATASEQTLQNFEIEPTKLLVLWQGIIFSYKGIHLLLQAWRQGAASGGYACLLIAGAGASRLLAQIRRPIRRL